MDCNKQLLLIVAARAKGQHKGNAILLAPLPSQDGR